MEYVCDIATNFAAESATRSPATKSTSITVIYIVLWTQRSRLSAAGTRRLCGVQIERSADRDPQDSMTGAGCLTAKD